LVYGKRSSLGVTGDDIRVMLEQGWGGGRASLTDVISSIVGDLPMEPGEEPAIVQHEDGSWLLDGAVDLDTALHIFARRIDAE